MRPAHLGIADAALFLLGACGEQTRQPTDLPTLQAVVPSDDVFETVRSRADQLEEWPEIISPSSCQGYGFIWLDLGSAWVLAESSEDGSCQVWLGGETENPAYDGRPTQFCMFDGAEPSVPVLIGQGGPARVEHPDCGDMS